MQAGCHEPCRAYLLTGNPHYPAACHARRGQQHGISSARKKKKLRGSCKTPDMGSPPPAAAARQLDSKRKTPLSRAHGPRRRAGEGLDWTGLDWTGLAPLHDWLLRLLRGAAAKRRLLICSPPCRRTLRGPEEIPTYRAARGCRSARGLGFWEGGSGLDRELCGGLRAGRTPDGNELTTHSA